MLIIGCRAECFVPQAQTLKDRRQVVRSLVHRLRHRFAVAVADVTGDVSPAEADLWQRAVIGIALVTSSEQVGRRALDQIMDYLESDGTCEISRLSLQVHEQE